MQCVILTLMSHSVSPQYAKRIVFAEMYQVFHLVSQWWVLQYKLSCCVVIYRIALYCMLSHRHVLYCIVMSLQTFPGAHRPYLDPGPWTLQLGPCLDLNTCSLWDISSYPVAILRLFWDCLICSAWFLLCVILTLMLYSVTSQYAKRVVFAEMYQVFHLVSQWWVLQYKLWCCVVIYRIALYCMLSHRHVLYCIVM